MSRDIISKVLVEARKTKIFTIDYMAKRLGVRKEVIEKVVGLLLAQGKLKRIKLECPCNKCPFSKICSLKKRTPIVEYYQLSN